MELKVCAASKSPHLLHWWCSSGHRSTALCSDSLLLSPLPPAQKKKRKYRPRCCSNEILEKYGSIRLCDNSGDSLMSTLRDLFITYTTFVRTFKPIGEMEALEPGLISSLNLQMKALTSLAKLCKDRLKLKVTKEKRDEAEKDGLIVELYCKQSCAISIRQFSA